MQKIQLYKVEREDGGYDITPKRPQGDYTLHGFRLIADEGKILVNGDIQAFCIDTLEPDEWEEIDAPDEDSEQIKPE